MKEEESIGAQMARRRYEKMTPEERTAAARNAANKRWEAEGKKKTGKGKKAK